jgi:hypothetical protein
LIAPDGLAARPVRIGLNDPWVLEQLRASVNNEEPPSGAGLLLVQADQWRSWLTAAGLPKTFQSGAFVLCYMFRQVSVSDFREVETNMRWWICPADGAAPSELPGNHAASILRLLQEPRTKVRLPDSMPAQALRSIHHDAMTKIHADLDGSGQVATGVFPLAALLIESIT